MMRAITNAHILTMDASAAEKEITNGSILFKNGKITAIGADITIPAEAEVSDAGGRLLTPGLIEAHSHLGVAEEAGHGVPDDTNESTDPLTPDLKALDAINPQEESFANARQAGVTATATGPGSGNVIGGTFAAIKTGGESVCRMLIKDDIALKCAVGENPKRLYGSQGKTPITRMATAALMREAFFKARRYQQRKEAAGDDTGKMPDYDGKLEVLTRALAGELVCKIHCHRADDIETVLRIACEFQLKITLDHCTDGHLVTDMIKASGFPAIVGPGTTGKYKFEVQNRTWETPAIMQRAGILLAITTDHPVAQIQMLTYCAAMAVRAGLPEQEALKAITINPAQILGLDRRIGSLTVGKDADMVLWDRPPLDNQARALETIIDGKTVYKE